MKRDRLTPDERALIERLARMGYSDWEIFRATGHARTTINTARRKAGIRPTTDRSGQPPRRIPRHLLRRDEGQVDPAVALYRAEMRRRIA